MTEVAIYQPDNQLAIPDGAVQLDSWIVVADQAVRLAREICNTPFVPDGLRGSAPAVAAAILAGRELGIGPMTALAHIHVIKGKPGLSAALMRALILAQGHEWQDVDVSDSRCVVRGRRKGETQWTEAGFTADQARRAHIDLGGYPQDKLYARATSRLARRKFADVIAGMPYSAEELEDGDTGHAPEVTPEPAPESAKPRTVQRKSSKTPAAQAATAEKPAEQTRDPAPQDTTGPPLPGEDDTDYDTPGTAPSEQLTALWATFTEDYGFKTADKELARSTVEQIIGRHLDGGTTKDLSRNEAGAAIDTLKRCGGDWDKLQALLGDGNKPDGDNA